SLMVVMRSRFLAGSDLRQRAGRRDGVMVHAGSMWPVLKFRYELDQPPGRLLQDSPALVRGGQGRLPNRALADERTTPVDYSYRSASECVSPLESPRATGVGPGVLVGVLI